MFFKKKKNTNPVPPKDIEKMISEGMGDKEIIKKLKSDGYSYENIETAMMQAVKSGVSDDKPNDIFAEPTNTAPSQAAPLPDQTAQQIPNMDIMDEASVEEFSPEQIVEELVEGVVDSKWKKFDEKLERLNTEVNSLRDATRNTKPVENGDSKEYEDKVNKLSKQVEDISVRVGGLEKAFKQFLPSLTRNIQSLSGIIHEMKKKQV